MSKEDNKKLYPSIDNSGDGATLKVGEEKSHEIGAVTKDNEIKLFEKFDLSQSSSCSRCKYRCLALKAFCKSKCKSNRFKVFDGSGGATTTTAEKLKIFQ